MLKHCIVKMYLETLHPNSLESTINSVAGIIGVGLKFPHKKLAMVDVHHLLIRAFTTKIFSENNKRPWTFIRK